MLSDTRRAVVISLIFNVYWLASVLLRENAQLLLLTLLFIAVLFDRKTVLVAPLIAVLGLTGDLLLTASGIFVFNDGEPSSALMQTLMTYPVWLVYLWFGFSVFLWLVRSIISKYSLLVLVPVSSFSGASSYFFGYRLDLVVFPLGELTTLMVLLSVWAFYGWLFVLIVRRFTFYLDKNGMASNQSTQPHPLVTDMKAG